MPGIGQGNANTEVMIMSYPIVPFPVEGVGTMIHALAFHNR